MNELKTPDDYLREHEDQIPPQAIDKARELLDGYDRWKYGKSPLATAAGAAYLGCSLSGETDITQLDIANMFDVSPTTVRTHYQLLWEERQE